LKFFKQNFKNFNNLGKFIMDEKISQNDENYGSRVNYADLRYEKDAVRCGGGLPGC
jgi:hypothetical protein